MFVNKIWSSKTQLPYSYYSLPFCRPEHIETERENIGQVLIGDRIQNSDYQVRPTAGRGPTHPPTLGDGSARARVPRLICLPTAARPLARRPRERRAPQAGAPARGRAADAPLPTREGARSHH